LGDGASFFASIVGVTSSVKRLLKVKADLERELETWSLNCSKCLLDVYWVHPADSTASIIAATLLSPEGHRRDAGTSISGSV
jgi:hypothetical protein